MHSENEDIFLKLVWICVEMGLCIREIGSMGGETTVLMLGREESGSVEFSGDEMEKVEI